LKRRPIRNAGIQRLTVAKRLRVLGPNAGPRHLSYLIADLSNRTINVLLFVVPAKREIPSGTGVRINLDMTVSGYLTADLNGPGESGQRNDPVPPQPLGLAAKGTPALAVSPLPSDHQGGRPSG